MEKKSDSGNMIEDAYSGFMIRMIEYSDEEGYNEAGFKTSTHAFIEKSDNDKVLENLMKPTTIIQVCENPRSQMICDILSGISKNIGISVTEIREIVVRVATTICDEFIISEEVYNKKAKKEEEKKGVKLPPYKKTCESINHCNNSCCIIYCYTNPNSYIFYKTCNAWLCKIIQWISSYRRRRYQRNSIYGMCYK